MGFLPSGEVALSLGEEVAGLRVLSTGAGRLAVTTRPPYTTSTLAAFANVSSQLWLRGAVQQTTAIAIFVVLQPPGQIRAVKGFVHVAELDERAVDEVFVGDSIRVRILDTSRGYLELSLKPLDAAA
ncbi:petA [Symbiodinium necroappetens]|uniref:PetA protein n=1 Tax=Symbiodinium necroappetens TaxID=1628268 RepID=A0A812TQC0_9DINO|nr:petA [Symbiodinium necroappetens]